MSLSSLNTWYKKLTQFTTNLTLGTGISTTLSSISGGANREEALQTSGVVILTAPSGQTGSVTFTDSQGDKVSKAYVGTGTAQAITLLATDFGASSSQISDGLIKVFASVDGKNGAQTQFLLDSSPPTLTATETPVISATRAGTALTSSSNLRAGDLIKVQVFLNYADDFLNIFNNSGVDVHYAGSNLSVQIGSNTRSFAIVSIATSPSNKVVGGVLTKVVARVTYNFEYTVVAGDLDSDGISIAANALTNSNGYLLRDPAGNKITSVTIPVIADGSNNFRVNAPSVAPQQALDLQAPGAIDGFTVADAAGNTAGVHYNFAPLG